MKISRKAFRLRRKKPTRKTGNSQFAGQVILRRLLVPLAFFLLFCAGSMTAQTIDLRLSVKFILSTNNFLPWNTGGFGSSSYGLNNPADVSNNIAYANTLLAKHWRGYRFQLIEAVRLTNVAQWFEAEARSESNRNGLDATAKADPARYAYRNNAVNIYINNTSSGYCSFPGDHDVILLGSAAYDTLIIHEVGHYFALRHTHEGEGFWISYPLVSCAAQDCDCPVLSGGNDDGIGDTIWDHECWNRSDLAANNPGASEADLDNVFLNIMSYHLPQDRFTERQLDRWADAASTSRDQVATGRTWFVSRTGVCDLPAGRSKCLETLVPVNGPFGAISSAVNAANANGGDIIILRPGNYNQTPTINKPLTLRATLDGFATIGSP